MRFRVPSRSYLPPRHRSAEPGSAVWRRALRRAPVVLGLACMAGCANPRSQAAVAQALSDAATEIDGLKNDIATLQEQLDALHETVMKQDSTIARIAAVNNIPVVR